MASGKAQKKTPAKQAPAKSESAGKPLKKGDHLFLVDGSGYIFRAYHALPPLTRKSDGLPIGAVAGFCNMLYKLIEDTKDEFEPTHLAVIFDASSKTFRNDIYPRIQGEPRRTPGRSRAAICAGARCDASLRRPLHRETRLRG